MLGRYIDALPSVAITRILESSAWCVRGYVDDVGARDILGHAEDWFWNAATLAPGCNAPELLPLREATGDSWLNWPPLISQRFDHLAEKLSLNEVVRLIQHRATTRASALPDHIAPRWQTSQFQRIANG